MSTVTQFIGLAIWVVSLGAFWHALAGRRNLPAALVWPGYLALLPLAFMFRGLLGEASLALPALCHLAATRSSISGSARLLLLTILCSALAINGSALGAIEADLYATGYVPGAFLVAVFLLSVAAYRWLPILGWSWLVGLGLAALGLHPSPNVWDALIDIPSVLLIAFVLATRKESGLSRDGIAGDCGSAGTARSDGSHRAPD